MIQIKNRFTGQVIMEIENFEKADLSSANLNYADLRYADLSSADLSSANLSHADLSHADLRSADLRSADLRYADLRSANLRSADLRSADLRYADLRYANLSSANLRYANLRYASFGNNSVNHLFSVSGIGSRTGITNYNAKTDTIYCGCFKGTMQEFADKVNQTHGANDSHRTAYIAAIQFFKACKESYQVETEKTRAR